MNSLESLFKKYKGNTNILIETGTYNGGGIASGLKAGFKKIYSYELIRELCWKAVERFGCHGDRISVFNQNSSSTHFSSLVQGLTETAVFWLDAHKMGPNGKIPFDYPLSAELTAIGKSKIPHIVLMDDFRLFDRYGVTESDVVKLLSQNCSEFEIVHETIRDSYPNDVLCFVPKEKK